MLSATQIQPEAPPAAEPSRRELRPLEALCGPKHARRFTFAGVRVYENAVDVAGARVDPPPLVHEYRFDVNRRWLCVSIDRLPPYVRCWQRDTGRELPQAVAVRELIT